MEMRTDEAEHRVPNDVAEQAGCWDARLRAPDCTEADRTRFAEWRDASSQHRIAFDRLQVIVASLRSAVSSDDAQQFWQAAVRDANRRRRVLLFAKAASVAALAVAATILSSLPENTERSWGSVRERVAGSFADKTSSYTTVRGQRSTITLPDGSKVELNARSEIKVLFSKRRRHVELAGGQALFHVAKDAQRPFTVSAGNREIIAIGTAFDVQLDERSLRVTLIEGKVVVHAEPDPRIAQPDGAVKLPVAEAPDKEARGDFSYLASRADRVDVSTAGSRVDAESRDVLLVPGQQLIAPFSAHEAASGLPANDRGDGSTTVRAVDVHNVTAWRQGRVFFEDHTLRDAVAEINRHNRIQIRVEDAQLARLRINGMFRAGEFESFVAALEDYFPIVARARGEEIILEPAR